MIQRMRFGIACCLLCLPASLLAANTPSGQVPGRWLVDRARTYGLNTQNPTLLDAEFMLLWLDAGSRLSPSFPDSYLWEYDLHRRMNHPDEALEALNAYCKLVPENTVARMDQIALGYDKQQTAETRLAFCQKQLAVTDLPPVIASDLHLRMATLYTNFGDDEKALAEARKAVELNSYNQAASMMVLDLEDGADDPVKQVQLMLSRVAANPARGDSLHTLAQYLDQLGMHQEAISLYTESIDDFRRRNPDLRLPESVLLDLARSYCDAKNYDKAMSVCDSLLTDSPDYLPAWMLKNRIVRSSGSAEEKAQVIEETQNKVSALLSGAQTLRSPFTLAAIAWFYTEYQPAPDKAVSYAQKAHDLAPDDPEINCVLGLALISNDQAEEAANLLEPLADVNAAAAVGLARAKLALGYRDAAIELLKKAETIRSSGLAYEYAVSMLQDLEQAPSPKPDRAAIRRLLDNFNSSLLDFDDHPEKALKFQAGLYQKQFAYGDPIECAFRISNISDYVITLGPDAMLNPEVLVSVSASGGSFQELDGYLSVSLYQRHLLMPGDEITVQQTINVGPLKNFLVACPQQDTSLEFTFILDPMRTSKGDWDSCLPGMEAVRIRTRRTAVNASSQGLSQLYSYLEKPDAYQRIRAIHALAGLIAESNAAKDIPLGHSAFSVNTQELLSQLLSTLFDQDPLVRAHALDSLGMVPLDDKIINDAAGTLSDPHWIVRLMAFNLFAQGQGADFKPVADRMSQSDPDKSVRKLASLFLTVMQLIHTDDAPSAPATVDSGNEEQPASDIPPDAAEAADNAEADEPAEADAL